jgi:serine/threonine protein kinase
MSELKVGKKYRVVKKIGAGSFGDIYLGINDATKEEVGESFRRARTHPSRSPAAGFPAPAAEHCEVQP